MIHEYKCSDCMKLTSLSLPPHIDREVIICKYCNGKATKNGKLSDRTIYKDEKIKLFI